METLTSFSPNFLELPWELVKEIRRLLSPPSSVALGLATSSLLDLHRRDLCSFLKGRQFTLSCASYGEVNLLKWFLGWATGAAAELRWLHAGKAAKAGELELLAFLHEEKGISIDSSLADFAALHSRQNVLQYLIDHGVKLTADTFLHVGRRNLFEWLWANISEDDIGASEALSFVAPFPFFLDFLKFVLSKTTDIDLAEVSLASVSWGQIEAVKYIVQKFGKGEDVFPLGALDTAIESRDLEMTKLLVHFGVPVDETAYVHAKSRMITPIVEYFDANFLANLNHEVIASAVQQLVTVESDQQINKFIFEIGGKLDGSAIATAFKAGANSELVDLLASAFLCPSTNEAALECVKRGDEELLIHYLGENGVDQCYISECRELAEELGFYHISVALKEFAAESYADDSQLWDSLMNSDPK